MGDKKEILKLFSDEKDRLFAARAADLALLAEKRYTPQFCGFLDLREQGVFRLVLSALSLENFTLFGGFPEAERKMGGVGCDAPPLAEDFPLAALRISVPRFRTLSHRDYLGTLMSLGTQRSKIGDIVTNEDGALIFVARELAEFFCEGLAKIGGVGAKTEILTDLPAVEIEQKREEIRGSIPSARLDAVIAELAHVSRGKAAAMIDASLVKVMDREEHSHTRIIEEGDVIAIRGMGKFQVIGLTGRTKKGNTVILANRYI